MPLGFRAPKWSTRRVCRCFRQRVRRRWVRVVDLQIFRKGACKALICPKENAQDAQGNIDVGSSWIKPLLLLILIILNYLKRKQVIVHRFFEPLNLALPPGGTPYLRTPSTHPPGRPKPASPVGDRARAPLLRRPEGLERRRGAQHGRRGEVGRPTATGGGVRGRRSQQHTVRSGGLGRPPMKMRHCPSKRRWAPGCISVSFRWGRGGFQGGVTTEPEDIGQEP